jgi:hypothetical protein
VYDDDIIPHLLFWLGLIILQFSHDKQDFNCYHVQ